MAEYSLTKKAVEDLSAIWEYTYDTWSEKQADKYYKLIISFFEAIALNPASGKKYDEIGNDILGRKAGRHIIFYRILKSGIVEVVRLLHESMDLKSRFVN